jgi:ubiquinone/menaquinone biosynthesis C-methylase UbiE
MNTVPANINETAAARAFDSQAAVFDRVYGNDTIIAYKRKRVREHMNRFLSPGSHILELNAGTGEDAVCFGNQGHQVHATDISGAMLEKLRTKSEACRLNDRITSELCSYTDLDKLRARGPYDHIFSNFAGLNCTSRLTQVLDSFESLLKPGGYVTLVMLPRFCLWEFMLMFRGKFRTAFRRFSGKKGTPAKVEGLRFTCWYYDPAYITKHLKEKYRAMKPEGLCTLVPPSYLQGFAEKHPGIFRVLEKMENKLKNKWPWRSIGDYYILTLQKK